MPRFLILRPPTPPTLLMKLMKVVLQFHQFHQGSGSHIKIHEIGYPQHPWAVIQW